MNTKVQLTKRYIKGPFPFQPGRKVGKLHLKLQLRPVNEKATLVVKRLAKRIIRLENILTNRYGYASISNQS